MSTPAPASESPDHSGPGLEAGRTALACQLRALVGAACSSDGRAGLRGRLERMLRRLSMYEVPEPIAGQFRARQRQSVMQVLPFSSLGVVCCAGAVGYTYWSAENTWFLSFWLLSLLGLKLKELRAKSYFAVRATASKRSLRLIGYNAAIVATLWSFAPLLLLGQGTSAQEGFLLYACIGLASGGVFSLAMVPMAATAWLLITASAVAVAFASRHPESTALVLAMTTFYVGLALSMVWTMGRQFTARLMAEAESARQHGMVQLLLRDFEDNATDMLWQTDSAGLVLQPSPRFSAAVGMSLEQLAVTPLVEVLRRQRPHALRHTVGESNPWLDRLNASEPFRDVLVPLSANGELRWWSVTAKPLLADDGSRCGWRGVATDVTGVQRKNEDLRFLAERDALTGLTNRREFQAHLAASMGKVPRGPGLTLVCLDLDHFKKVNDTHGHIVGDRLLRETGRRLLTLTRPKDTVARLGSDEFAVILPGIESPQSAEIFVARLQDALHQPCEIDGLRLPLRVSIGIAVSNGLSGDVDQLLSDADLALYAAKREGRATYRLFRPDMGALARRRQLLERDLREAVARNELRVVFQPQVRCSDGRITGFESLARWRHAGLGEISPLEFIPIAEETGYIVELGAWVLSVAARKAQRLPAGMLVSVNVSAVQVMTPGFRDVVSRVLAESGLPPHRLELEITESVFVGDSTHTVDVLQSLHAVGVRIALDDFGTGYSSLAYLRRFPFDTLKIDKAFVQELLTSKDARAIVETIISLAQTLGMDTVAEGVEEQAQADLLEAKGCSLIQGYLMSRPLPADEVEAFIAGWSPRKDTSAQDSSQASLALQFV